MRTWPTVVAAVLGAAACADGGVTQTMVRIDIDPRFGGRGHAVMVEVFGHEGASVYRERRSIDSPPVLRFPANVPLIPRDGRQLDFRLVATLLDSAGRSIAADSVASAHVSGETREIWLCFDTSCEDARCDASERCRRGRCVSNELDSTPLGAGPEGTCGTECEVAEDCACEGDACEDGICVPELAATRVAAGTRSTAVVASDASLFAWGANERGQLGVGDAETRLIPERVEGLEGVTSVDLGDGHGCAIADGMIYCWGGPDRSRTAREETLPDALSPLPVECVFPMTGWVDVTAGRLHSVFLASSGDAVAAGHNGSGQLGADVGEYGATCPVTIEGAWSAIDSGPNHACGVRRSDGRLRCWGQFEDGRLAEGEPPLTEDQRLPRAAALTASIDTLAIGDAHGCATTREGALFCWGSNAEGQLGTGVEPALARAPVAVAPDREWSRVDAGGAHTCGVTAPLGDERSLWCWGSNAAGQVGVGDTMRRSEPSRVGVPRPLDVATGQVHTCAIDEAGRVFCWGSNAEGQLGLGHREDRDVPTRVCLTGRR